METYIKTVITELQILKLRNRPKTNLTPEEKQRLNLLQNNQHIVVKPADKVSAIVIMNRTDYITEATRQSSDNKFYTKTQVDLTGTHNNKITQTLPTMLRNDKMAQSVYRNLVTKDCKTPAFYFMPKIHQQNITGRPIISGNNSPTEKISAFVDEHIKQFVPRVKSYVRDTPDFIKKMENFKLNGDYFLVGMDATSLYTNIPNHEGLVAVTHLYAKTHDFTPTTDVSKCCYNMSYTWTTFSLTGKITCKLGVWPWAHTWLPHTQTSSWHDLKKNFSLTANTNSRYIFITLTIYSSSSHTVSKTSPNSWHPWIMHIPLSNSLKTPEVK